MFRKAWPKMMISQFVRRLTSRVGPIRSSEHVLAAQISPPNQNNPNADQERSPSPYPASAIEPTPPEIGALQLFKGYQDIDLRIFQLFIKQGLEPKLGFVTDFLGGRTRISILYDAVKPLDGQLLGFPIPGDFHAETVEWIGVMKTALTARHRYVAMEWGAGWAPWLVAGAMAAQHLGISDIKLYGVEADRSHFKAMQQHFSDNGFTPEDHVLLQAAVGVKRGSACWPDEPDPRNQWGARPVRVGSAQDIDYLCARVDRFVTVEILQAKKLLLREPTWDMIHIDIQGWEGEVCRSCIGTMSERVKWVVIGVHSRIQDAELLQIFHRAGWTLEHEKPTRFQYRPSQVNFEAMVTADGTQVWRNPRLAAAPNLTCPRWTAC